MTVMNNFKKSQIGGFYSRLAWTNIIKNSQIYMPFIAMNIFLVAMFMMIRTISVDPGMANMSGGGTLKSLMGVGVGVMVIFTSVLVFYTNGFLMKRRKKEIGVYNILGFSKRHIARMMGLETLLIAIMCTVIGIILGLVGMKLIYLVLLRLTGYPLTLGLPISWSAIRETILMFFVLFFVITLYNIIHITLAKPIELLRGSQVGEREPKSRWILALSGLISLFGAYYFAITVTSPVQAMTIFFIAVIAVIYATYALFTTGSIVFLKHLRANKKFYYQTRHFAVISGMLYRMKQHAAGLATLCILSTMVMITVSTTLSLYMGLEDSLVKQYPRDVIVTVNQGSEKEVQALKDHIVASAQIENIAISDLMTMRTCYSLIKWDEATTQFVTTDEFVMATAMSLLMMDQETYEVLYGTIEGLDTLGSEPFLAMDVSSYNKSFDKKLDLKNFKVNETNLSLSRINYLPSDALKSPETQLILVFPKIEEALSYLIAIKPEVEKAYDVSVGFDMRGDSSREIAFAQWLRDNPYEMQEVSRSYVASRSFMRKDFTDVYGGLLFLGIFLGALFLSATVIIMYYKQITEGYEDQVRYETMQKVGMHHDEIRQAIGTQTIIVFFLPLAVASLHIAFSFNIVSRMLNLFNFSNDPLFVMCSVETAVAFALVYLFFYRLTARTYFSIVKWQV